VSIDQTPFFTLSGYSPENSFFLSDWYTLRHITSQEKKLLFSRKPCREGEPMKTRCFGLRELGLSLVLFLSACSDDGVPTGSCDDGSKNQNESDVDCGGVCGTCSAGKACGVDGDCESGSCVDGVCQESQTSPKLPSHIKQTAGGGSASSPNFQAKVRVGVPLPAGASSGSGKQLSGSSPAAP